MTNNITLSNTSRIGCYINLETVHEVRFYTDIVTSVTSFLGNIILILAVFQIRTRRTTTDYLVVNMAISDVFIPTMRLLYDILVIRRNTGYLSQTFGTFVCKFYHFFHTVSCGVSITSLVIITVIRFYAVAFPLRARVQSRLRTRVIFLSFTWVVPIAMFSPSLFFVNFLSKHRDSCSDEVTIHQRRIYYTVLISFYLFVPLLVMMFLYPVIIVKLRRQKIPGNANCPRALIRRRKQSHRLTTMFITITVVFMLTWGIRQILIFIGLFSNVADWCTYHKVYRLFDCALPNVFHATSPLTYFVFCPSYRRGIKEILSCRRTQVHRAPGGGQIELGDIQQA